MLSLRCKWVALRQQQCHDQGCHLAHPQRLKAKKTFPLTVIESIICKDLLLRLLSVKLYKDVEVRVTQIDRLLPVANLQLQI